MDPDVWLAEMRELIGSRDPDDFDLMLFMLEDMAEWLAKGGFPPAEYADVVA